MARDIDTFEDDEEIIVESSGLAEELKIQLKSAPWYILSAFAHMIVLILLMLLPTQPKEKIRKQIVINTDIVEPEEPEEEEEVKDEIDPIDEIKTEDTDPTEVTESTVETDVEVVTDIEVDEVSAEVGDMTEEDSGEAIENPNACTLGVGGGAVRGGGGVGSGNRGGIGGIGQGLHGMLKKGGGGGRGLILVWLLDQSASMKDDQEAIASQAEDIQALLTNGGRKKMLSAVVTFGEGWQITQKPITNADKITEKIRSVEIDKSGIENTDQAIIYTCQNVMSKYRGYTKVIVLLSDESAGDNHKRYRGIIPTKGAKINISDKNKPLIEVALKTLLKSKTRLFVISKESPFQSNFVVEPFTDENGNFFPEVRADLGPESARIEVPINDTVGINDPSIRGGLKAGYGMYDLAYLAKGSRGAYFILEDGGAKKKAMTYSERMKDPFAIDWKVMESYAPAIVSRAVYDGYMKKKYGKQASVIVRTNGIYSSNKASITRWKECASPQTFSTKRLALRKRSGLLKKIVAGLKSAVATDSELVAAKNKRQIANVDLYYAAALTDQMLTDVLTNAWNEYKGEMAEPADPDYFATISSQTKPKEEWTEEEAATYEERLAAINAACNEVIRRHANTPYASIAQWIPGVAQSEGLPRKMIYRKIKIVKDQKQGPSGPSQ